MKDQRVLPTQAAAAELFKACEMDGAGLVAMEALNWLWALNPSFPSIEPPVMNRMSQYNSLSSFQYSFGTESDIDRPAFISSFSPENTMQRGGEPSPVVVAVPDMVFCSRTLTALSNQGLSERCLVLLEEMRERGLSPTAACYAIALSALEKEAEWQKAVNLLLQMQTRGILVDYRAVNTAMSACAKSQQWGMILKLYDQMPTVTGNAFIPNQFSHFQALVSACKTKNPTKAIEILRAKAAMGILPSTASIAQVMTALEAAERHDDMVMVFEEFVSSHLGDLSCLFSHALIGTTLCVACTHIESRFCNPRVVIFT
jgi:pentatricopeptide repeat protein